MKITVPRFLFSHDTRLSQRCLFHENFTNPRSSKQSLSIASRIWSKRDGKQIRITVSDCGSGVPEEKIEKLFNPFYRLETDRSRATGGTGLGLTIAKTCVESCQGTVSARNRASKGFEVTTLLKASPMK